MKQHTNKVKLAVLTLGTSVLAACGGGGDEAPSTPSTATFPLAQVADTLIKPNASFAVRIDGTASGNGQSFPLTGTGTVSASTTSSSFEGVTGLKRTITTTGTMQASGLSVPVADTSADYFGQDNKPLGRIATGAYCVYANQIGIPSAAKVGDNATWYTGTCYTSSSKITRVGTTQVSYVLEPDTDTTAILKLIQKLTDNSGQTGTASSAYRISTTGTVTRLTDTASIVDSGVRINLTITYP